MKKIVFLFTFVFSTIVVAQDSSFKNVEKTLQDYITGSSYNKLKQLENAFTADATLYLTGKDGFKIYTPKEYVGFFKNKKKGEFNGRVGKILSIEIFKDIATAKAEIAGPNRDWVYIDLFLLKETVKGWKIISKTATKVSEPKIN
ncbi:MAG: nuclear transport factor 2 family protein [Polaribacter sp.]